MITEYYTTIGMDVSDRKIQVCVMTKSGVNPKIVTETTIPTTKEGVQKTHCSLSIFKRTRILQLYLRRECTADGCTK